MARRGAIAVCFFLQTFDDAISAAAVAIAVLRRHRRHWLCAQTQPQPNSHAAVCFLFDQQFDRPGGLFIVPVLPGEHTFELKMLEQPPIFRNSQAWPK